MIDTHAHLLCADNCDEIINNMKNDNLSVIVNIGTNLEDSIAGIELANHYENVYTTVGFYPEYAESLADEDFEKLASIAKNEKVVAIGEIGLDYHSDNYNKEKQKEVFIKQLKIADKLNLPFCIHCRNAVKDVYEILKENKHLINHSGLMHCYSEGKEWFQKFINLGMYISFSGNITFKKNDRSFLKEIPLNRILVETDSPYLSPEPLRGQKNQPKNVNLVAKKIAETLEIDFEKFDEITTKNAKTFYYKIKHS